MSGNAGLMGGYGQRQPNTEEWSESLKEFWNARPVMNKTTILKYQIHIYVFLRIFMMLSWFHLFLKSRDFNHVIFIKNSPFWQQIHARVSCIMWLAQDPEEARAGSLKMWSTINGTNRGETSRDTNSPSHHPWVNRGII